MIKFKIAPPGSFKTLSIVQVDIPQALKAGKKVYHNIPGIDAVKIAYYCKLYPNDVENQLEYMYAPYIEKYVKDEGLEKEADKIGLDKIEEKYYKDLSKIYRYAVPDILEHIPTLGRNYLIVIDEVQNFVPATDYKESKNVKFFEYATVHRHLGHELVLATQHEDNVDVKIRRIANLLVYMYRRDILGKVFSLTATEKHYAGCATGNPELLNKYIFHADKRVFKLYKSYVAEGIVEKRKYRSIWFNAKLIALGILLILCLTRVPGFFRQWGIFVGKEKPVSKEIVKLPSDYFGTFAEYYCGEGQVYILRRDGFVDSLPSNKVPTNICPRLFYSSSRNEVSK